MTTAQPWSKSDWRGRPRIQMPDYPDPAALHAVEGQLAKFPPLVFAGEARRLKRELADVAKGGRFLLQGGDCAESFADCESALVSNRLKVLLQMSLVLIHGLQLPVVRLGRFAGQYAKPRSADTETRDGISLPSYRGDLVNGPGFTAEERTPDPQRLLLGHARSAMTMNFVRGLIDGGFADIHHPEYWDLDWVGHSPQAAEYQHITETIAASVKFMETLAGREVGSFSRVDFYTSHEALHLPSEQAHTRRVPRRNGWWNLSTHFPWIGMRTAAVDGAHVEFCRGIRNPIGIKIGPGMSREWLTELIEVLDPNNEPGRLTLIHRMGADQIVEHLPPLIEAVRGTGKLVLWCCDPMHGNTEKTGVGLKTRRFDKIRSELEQAFDIHADSGSRLGGVHLELTGEDVTECTGGARALGESDLERAYKSTVDPRLNYEQSIEMAMLIGKKSTLIRAGRP